jgi:hypothetical protein
MAAKQSHELWRRNRRWIVVNAVGLTAVLNLLVNGGIAWLSTIGVTRVALWTTPILGGPSTITDTIGTLLLLPLITNLLTTTAVRREVRAGRLTPLRDPPCGGAIQRLPHGRPARGLVLAACTTILLGPPAVLTLIVTGFGDVSRLPFVLYKASLGVALGVLVTPVIAVSALAAMP